MRIWRIHPRRRFFEECFSFHFISTYGSRLKFLKYSIEPHSRQFGNIVFKKELVPKAFITMIVGDNSFDKWAFSIYSYSILISNLTLLNQFSNMTTTHKLVTESTSSIRFGFHLLPVLLVAGCVSSNVQGEQNHADVPAITLAKIEVKLKFTKIKKPKFKNSAT